MEKRGNCDGKVPGVVGKALSAVASAEDDRWLVCVSGGADSVALLVAMWSLGAEVEVANCNFHLRGEESDRDSEFVAALCRRLGVLLHRLDFDTADYCREHQVSIEMGCRELRYSAFRRLRKERDCRRIVVAHNADDNIETLLLNLFRGTGLKGLCGMEPDTGEILRPLLGVTRKEIEEYLAENGEEYVEDSTNASDDYKRNFLRLRVLPLLESRWQGVRKSLTATIDNLRGSQAICERALAEALAHDEADAVGAATIDSFPSKRALLFERFAPKGATASQLREMESADRQGAEWRLPEGVVRLGSEGYRYFADEDLSTPEERFRVEELLLTPQLLCQITQGAPDNRVAWLPGKRSDYRWTTLRDGLRIAPMGMCGTKKIADLLRDAHIPAPKRASYPLLEEVKSRRIVWVPGVRRSRFAAVSRKDVAVVRFEMMPEKN